MLVNENNKLFKNATNTITIATGTKFPIESASAGGTPEPSKLIRPTFSLLIHDTIQMKKYLQR